MKISHRVLVAFALLPLPVIPVSADTLKVFEDATTYTVKIKSRIKYPFSEETRKIRTGAGFLVDKERGWVVTNAHVSTRNPSSLRVSFKGRKKFPSELLYVDPFLDLAVIKVPRTEIPQSSIVAPLGCTSRVEIGKPVGAFGHPFALSFTGTRGILSGYNFYEGKRRIQTDAAINKGNSGGPLIDLTLGKVIGINTSIISKKKAEGIGFAIPIQRVCRVLKLLRKGLDPSPPIIPVDFAPDPDEETGLNVAAVYQKLPVAWPLRIGDKILGDADGKVAKFETLGDLIDWARQARGKIKIKVLRGGREVIENLSVVPEPRVTDRTGIFVSGVNLAPFPTRDGEIQPYHGNLVAHDIKWGSAAQEAGFKTYDQLILVDGKAINKVKLLEAYLKEKKNNNIIVKFLLRRSKDRYQSGSTFKLVELKVDKIKILSRSKYPEKNNSIEKIRFIQNN